MRIAAPEGSICHPRVPAATAARAIACNRLAGANFDAMNQALAADILDGKLGRAAAARDYGAAGVAAALAAWTEPEWGRPPAAGACARDQAALRAAASELCTR